MKKKYEIEIELDTEVPPFERTMGVTSPYSRKFERQIAFQIESILNHVYDGQITACVSIADHSNEEEIPLKNKDLTKLDNAFSIRETIDKHLFETLGEMFRPDDGNKQGSN